MDNVQCPLDMADLFFNLAVLILSLHTRKPLFCNTILSNWYVTTLTSLQWYETASWMVFHSILVKILIYGELHIILLLLMFDSLSVIFFMLFQTDVKLSLTFIKIWCAKEIQTFQRMEGRGGASLLRRESSRLRNAAKYLARYDILFTLLL